MNLQEIKKWLDNQIKEYEVKARESFTTEDFYYYTGKADAFEDVLEKLNA